jgi:regulator of protease activity HflC (stomatin/prohibitin superfamily)
MCYNHSEVQNNNMIWLSILMLLICFVAFFVSRGVEDESKTIAKAVSGVTFAIALITFLFASVKVIKPGYVGVQTTFGTVNNRPLLNGVHMVNPFTSIQTVEIRTFEYTMSSTANEGAVKGDDSVRLFSKDILPMDADITIMWRPVPAMVPWLYQHIGTHEDFENKIIRPASRAAFRNAVVQYTAQEAITSGREQLSLDVAKQMLDSINKILSSNENYSGEAFIIQDVLIRNIEPPEKLKDAVQAKLVADQESQRMQFVLSKEKQEAERKRIEAQGIADFQRIVTQGISQPLLEWKGVEATLELAKSSNAKVVVIGSGKNGLPIILGQDK